MSEIKTGLPVTVLYRGTLEDTAILVGLAFQGVRVGTIAYTGRIDSESLAYINLVNDWLLKSGMPEISIHPSLKMWQLKNIVQCPLNSWGWKEQECKVALALVGFPFPKNA